MRVLMRWLVVVALEAGLWAQSTDELFQNAIKGDNAAVLQLRALADKGDAVAQQRLKDIVVRGFGGDFKALGLTATQEGDMLVLDSAAFRDSSNRAGFVRSVLPTFGALCTFEFRRVRLTSGEQGENHSLGCPEASGPKNNDILTNSSVIALVKGELPSDVIVTKVQSSDCRFQLNTDGLIALKQARVSDDIIRAMLARNCGASVTGNSSLSSPSNSIPQATPSSLAASTGNDSVEHIGNVLISRVHLVMEGREGVVFTIDARSTYGPMNATPRLSLSFQPAAKTQRVAVTLNTGGVVEADSYGFVERRVKFDEENPMMVTWARLKDSTTLEVWDLRTAPLPGQEKTSSMVIAKAMLAKKMYIEFAYYPGHPVVAEFDTSSLAVALVGCKECAALIVNV